MMMNLQARGRTNRRRPRVVIVDEDAHKRYLIAQLLRAEGYEVLTASGHEGVLDLFSTSLSRPGAWVSFVAAHRPDVVVVDVNMSSGTGLVTIGALAKHPLTMHLPVLAIGDAARPDDLRAAPTMGAHTTLSWPIGLEGLAPYVEDLIG